MKTRVVSLHLETDPPVNLRKFTLEQRFQATVRTELSTLKRASKPFFNRERKKKRTLLLYLSFCLSESCVCTYVQCRPKNENIVIKKQSRLNEVGNKATEKWLFGKWMSGKADKHSTVLVTVSRTLPLHSLKKKKNWLKKLDKIQLAPEEQSY